MPVVDPDPAPGAGPSAQPDITVAFETSARNIFGGKAGFFCVWENEITFVASAWVRWVMAYVRVLPARVAPTGPDDPRTRTRIPFADLTTVRSNTEGREGTSKALRRGVLGVKVAITTRDGVVRYYTGGRINPGFDFSSAAPLVAAHVEAAGYRTETSGETLTIRRDGEPVPDRPGTDER